MHFLRACEFFPGHIARKCRNMDLNPEFRYEVCVSYPTLYCLLWDFPLPSWPLPSPPVPSSPLWSPPLPSPSLPNIPAFKWHPFTFDPAVPSSKAMVLEKTNYFIGLSGFLSVGFSGMKNCRKSWATSKRAQQGFLKSGPTLCCRWVSGPGWRSLLLNKIVLITSFVWNRCYRVQYLEHNRNLINMFWKNGWMGNSWF